MIVNCHLNIELKWQDLPWLQINRRIALMQRKIFDASQEYNLDLLYQAQKIFINSFEARLFAIDKIISETKKYYNYENYLFNNIDKFYIFKYLFNNNSPLKVKLKMLTEQIKEYLIYLSLEPEWKARFNLLNTEYSNTESLKYFDSIEDVDLNKLIYQYKSSSYISKSIHYWFINNYYISNKYLKDLLVGIYNLKFNWCMKKISKFNYNNNCKYIKTKKNVNILKTSLINIFAITKSRFYYHNYLKKLKFKQNLNWPTMINQINLILQIELSKKNTVLKYFFISYILNQINNLLSLLNTKQKYHHFIHLLNYNKYNIYNLLYKKIISIYLYKYLFKINR